MNTELENISRKGLAAYSGKYPSRRYLEVLRKVMKNLRIACVQTEIRTGYLMNRKVVHYL
jgi:hypothetical protein